MPLDIKRLHTPITYRHTSQVCTQVLGPEKAAEILQAAEQYQSWCDANVILCLWL